MSEPPASPLLRAVSAYKVRAHKRLLPDQLQLAIRLLKELNRRLPNQNLLDGSLDEIKAAGGRLFAEGEPREHGRFLTAELKSFFDAALAEGLIAYHPVTGQARLQPESAAAPGITREQAAARAAALVAEVIEEGVQQGLMLSPLAIPLADFDQRRGAADRLVESLSGRWSHLARRLRPVLAIARVAIPLAAVALAISAASGPNPLSSRYGAAIEAGQAVDRIELTLNLIANVEQDSDQVSDLRDLGDRVGVPLDRAARVFALERMCMDPPILYLRHRKSGALVVITPERRATLRRGEWRVLR